MRYAIALFSIMLCLGSSASDDPREVIDRVGFDQKLDAQIPLNLTFRDENDKEVPLKNYFQGKPVLLTLVYHSCPMLCGAAQNGLVTCMRAMKFVPGKEFELVTISFDPAESAELSRAKKDEFVKLYGRIDSAKGWHFLTGDHASIEQLTKAVGYRYVYDQKSKQFAHPSGIILATPEGRISKYYMGVEYYPRDLTLGIVEASENKIGTLSDRVILYCYRYNPVTGKYGIVIMNILRLAGIATALSLGLFIITMLWRERLSKSALNRRVLENG